MRLTQEARNQRRALWAGIGAIAAVLTGFGQFIALHESPRRLLPNGWGAILALYGVVAVLIVVASEFPARQARYLLRHGIPVVATVIRRSGHGEEPLASEQYGTTVNQVVCAFTYPRNRYPNGVFATVSFVVSDALFDEWQLDAPILLLVAPILLLVAPDGMDFVAYRLLTGVEMGA